MRIIGRYNKRRHHYAEEFEANEDIKIIADMLLDLYRYRGVPTVVDA